jgi:broad specificity phosphatase PhoE
MTRIYLVRHGQTVWNADGRCQGQKDSAFTALGREQVDALAASLASVAFDAAYTSPLHRAAATSATVLGKRGLRAAAVPTLSELSYGALQGARFDDWPRELWTAWKGDPWSVTFPGGESLAMVRDRVLPVFHSIVAGHAGESVLISAHGHVNRLILLDVSDRPPADFWRIEQDNGGWALLDVFPDDGVRP